MNEVNENIVKFLEKVANDEELQAKMQKATNPDEAYAIASSVQDGFTKEEFVAVMQELNAQTDQELSDDDLEQVAGGKIKWSKIRDLLSKITDSISYVVSNTAKSAAA
jgi:predicted ribosomally synthesized peptide with nif11-like leader